MPDQNPSTKPGAIRWAAWMYILEHPLTPGVYRFCYTEKGRKGIDTGLQAINDHLGLLPPFQLLTYGMVPNTDFRRELHNHFADCRVRPRKHFFLLDPSEREDLLNILANQHDYHLEYIRRCDQAAEGEIDAIPHHQWMDTTPASRARILEPTFPWAEPDSPADEDLFDSADPND